MISHDRRALIARLAGLALAFAPAFVVAWHVGENAVDIPVWDGWERGELLEKQHDGELAFADLYAPHIEHRMVFPRLAMLALNALTGGDVRWEIAMTFLTVIASSLCFYYLLGKALPQGRWRYLAGLAINMVLFSPLQYQNFLWAAELAFMLPLACLAFCLAVSVSQLPTVAKFGLCVLAATVGMHSFAHGILIWVAVLLLYLLGAGGLVGRARVRFLSAFAALGAALLVCYVAIDFRVASHHSYGFEIGAPVPALELLGETVERPGRVKKYFLAALGNPLARYFSTDSRESARQVGRVFLVMFAGTVFIFGLHWRDRPMRVALLPWVVAGLFAVLVAALLALARSSINLDRAILPRYASLTLFLPVSLIGFGAHLLWRWVEEGEARGATAKVPVGFRVAASGALAALAVMVWWPGWVHGIRKMEQWKSARLQARAALAYLEHFEPQRVARLDKNLDLVRAYAPFLSERGWLRPGLVAEPGFGPFVPDENRLRKSDLRDAKVRHAEYSGGQLHASGHAVLPDDGRVADAVLLTWRPPAGGAWQAIGLAEPRGQAIPEMSFVDQIYNNGANLARPDQFAKWTAHVVWPDAPAEGFEFRAWALDASLMRAYPLDGGGILAVDRIAPVKSLPIP